MKKLFSLCLVAVTFFSSCTNKPSGSVNEFGFLADTILSDSSRVTTFKFDTSKFKIDNAQDIQEMSDLIIHVNYAINSLKTVSGLKFKGLNSICQGGVKVLNGQDCQPGSDWEKCFKQMLAIQLDGDTSYDGVMSKICKNYIMQNLNSSDHWTPLVNNFNVYGDKTAQLQIFETKTTISELYYSDIVTMAEQKLTAECNAAKLNFSADAKLTFEDTLKKELQSASNSSAQVQYIEMYPYGTGLPQSTAVIKNWALIKPAYELYASGKYDLITGVAGFALLNFQAKTTVVSTTSISYSINVALQGQDPMAVAKISASISGSVAGTVNKKINEEYNASAVNGLFQPLWIRRARFKDVVSP